MTPFNSAVFDDPKISETLAMLEAGKSKDDIVKHFGNKNWAPIDMYFRRRGFRWNKTTYVPIQEPSTAATEEARFIQTKDAQVVRLLSVKQADIRQIAIKNGFSNVEDLGQYMKANGYIWDAKLNNYEYDVTTMQKEETKGSTFNFETLAEGNEEVQQLLRFLMSKKHRLAELLEPESKKTLPRYTFKGAKANKTLGLPTSLQSLLADFSSEFNVTQRDIIEVALADFFRGYGFEEQLNQVLLS
ncbi:hypothetical protein [Sporosarcina sp. SAFN-010]|uniref:hypothetical protein n=1 Tax=Sporosarcina sp. SAFN-010 TaxID=3387273 RepID=UPI003F80BF61